MPKSLLFGRKSRFYGIAGALGGLPSKTANSSGIGEIICIIFTSCGDFIDVAVQFKGGQDVALNHSVAYVYYVFTAHIL